MLLQILPNDVQHVMDSAFPSFRIISCLCCVEVAFFPVCIVVFDLLTVHNRYVGKLVLVKCTVLQFIIYKIKHQLVAQRLLFVN